MAELFPKAPETPESLRRGIPWSRQSLKQLHEERAYWAARLDDAPLFFSARAANRMLDGIDHHIRERAQPRPAPSVSEERAHG